MSQSHESVRGRGLPLFLVIWVWLPGEPLFNTQSGAKGEGGLQCIRGGTGRATGRAKPDKLTHSKINQVSTSCYIHYTYTTEPSPAWITRPALFETYTVDCTSGRSALKQRERGRTDGDRKHQRNRSTDKTGYFSGERNSRSPADTPPQNSPPPDPGAHRTRPPRCRKAVHRRPPFFGASKNIVLPFRPHNTPKPNATQPKVHLPQQSTIQSSFTPCESCDMSPSEPQLRATSIHSCCGNSGRP